MTFPKNGENSSGRKSPLQAEDDNLLPRQQHKYILTIVSALSTEERGQGTGLGCSQLTLKNNSLGLDFPELIVHRHFREDS